MRLRAAVIKIKVKRSIIEFYHLGESVVRFPQTNKYSSLFPIPTPLTLTLHSSSEAPTHPSPVQPDLSLAPLTDTYPRYYHTDTRHSHSDTSPSRYSPPHTANRTCCSHHQARHTHQHYRHYRTPHHRQTHHCSPRASARSHSWCARRRASRGRAARSGLLSRQWGRACGPGRRC